MPAFYRDPSDYPFSLPGILKPISGNQFCLEGLPFLYDNQKLEVSVARKPITAGDSKSLEHQLQAYGKCRECNVNISNHHISCLRVANKIGVISRKLTPSFGSLLRLYSDFKHKIVVKQSSRPANIIKFEQILPQS